MLGLDSNGKLKVSEQNSVALNSILTSPKTKIELPIKSYTDSLHENSKKTRDLFIVFNDQDKEFDDSKLTNSESIKINRDLSRNNQRANKNYVDYSIRESTIVRLNQTLEDYLRVSLGNDSYIFAKIDRI